MKIVIIFSMTIFSWLGSYLPILWGDSMLSMTSVLFGALGGFLGIWFGFKFAHRLGLE